MDLPDGGKGRDEGRGLVIITSSCASMHNCTNVDLMSYATSKAGTDHLVALLASKFTRWYVRVCGINPGCMCLISAFPNCLLSGLSSVEAFPPSVTGLMRSRRQVPGFLLGHRVTNNLTVIPSNMNPIGAEGNMFAQLIDKVPAKRIGGLGDVAGTVIYLSSRAGVSVTIFMSLENSLLNAHVSIC